jgi:hypothetical protein
MAIATANSAGIHFINRSFKATFNFIPPVDALELSWIPQVIPTDPACVAVQTKNTYEFKIHISHYSKYQGIASLNQPGKPFVQQPSAIAHRSVQTA